VGSYVGAHLVGFQQWSGWPRQWRQLLRVDNAAVAAAIATAVAMTEVRAPDQVLPPIIFFFRIFWRDSYLAVLGKSGWWHGKTAHQKSHLTDFWYCAPSTHIWIMAKIVETMEGFPNPPTMVSLISAMLEHHKFPGWCSNIAVLFLVHLPAEISSVRA